MDIILDEQFVEVFGKAWLDLDEEEGPVKLPGARRRAGILALTRDPEFRIAAAELLDRLGLMTPIGMGVQQEIREFRLAHLEELQRGDGR